MQCGLSTLKRILKKTKLKVKIDNVAPIYRHRPEIIREISFIADLIHYRRLSMIFEL